MFTSQKNKFNIIKNNLNNKNKIKTMNNKKAQMSKFVAIGAAVILLGVLLLVIMGLRGGLTMPNFMFT